MKFYVKIFYLKFFITFLVLNSFLNSLLYASKGSSEEKESTIIVISRKRKIPTIEYQSQDLLYAPYELIQGDSGSESSLGLKSEKLDHLRNQIDHLEKEVENLDGILDRLKSNGNYLEEDLFDQILRLTQIKNFSVTERKKIISHFIDLLDEENERYNFKKIIEAFKNLEEDLGSAFKTSLKSTLNDTDKLPNQEEVEYLYDYFTFWEINKPIFTLFNTLYGDVDGKRMTNEIEFLKDFLKLDFSEERISDFNKESFNYLFSSKDFSLHYKDFNCRNLMAYFEINQDQTSNTFLEQERSLKEERKSYKFDLEGEMRRLSDIDNDISQVANFFKRECDQSKKSFLLNLDFLRK